MIGSPQSLNDIAIELGLGTGAEISIGTALSASYMDVPTDPDSFAETEGWDGDWWDYVQVTSACHVDQGGGDYDVNFTFYNFAKTHSRSGTFYYTIYDVYSNILASGNVAYGPFAADTQYLDAITVSVTGAANPPNYAMVKTNNNASSSQNIGCSGACS